MDVMLQVGYCGDVTRDGYDLYGTGELVLAVEVFDVDVGISTVGKRVEHDHHVHFELGCRDGFVEDACVEWGAVIAEDDC
jgi:hypothetical protein